MHYNYLINNIFTYSPMNSTVLVLIETSYLDKDFNSWIRLDANLISKSENVNYLF